jgi:outer membrane protein
MIRKKSRAAFLALSAAASAAAAFGQDEPASPPEVTLSQALDEAASSGGDIALVGKTLAAARLQRSLDLAKQALTLSASGGYSLADGLGASATAAEQSLLGRASSAAAGSGSAQTSNQGVAQQVQGSVSLGLPLTKVTLSASQGIPSSTAKDPSQSSVLGLTASQTIWDGYPGGQYQAALKKSDLTMQGKELTAVQGRSAALAKAKQAYITMLAAQRDLDVKKQVLDKQSKLLAQIQATYALKQASEIDLKTAQINAKGAELDAATADKTFRLANERLAVIMGRPAGSAFRVADVDEPELPAVDVDEAIRIGLSQRTDLAQYGLSARSARIDSALARAQSSPTLSLTGGAGLAVAWSGPSASSTALSLGAKVTLPLIDSGAAELQAKTSEAAASLYDAQAAQLRNTISSDIRDNYQTAQLLRQKIDLARQSAMLAESQFELVKTQNQYGTATVQDVLNASVAAASAEVAYGTARNSYLIAELVLETSMGL